MKKRILVILSFLPVSASLLAQTGLSAVGDVSDGIGVYLPYVQALCYVIAAVIALVGAVVVYHSMQTSPQQTAKRITMTVGSCFCFVCLATALPEFFGMDGRWIGSNIAVMTGGNSGNGDFLASNNGGIPQSGIDASIPPLSDGRWVKFPPGTNMDVARSLVDIFNHMGGGADGSYKRTLDYIHLTYKNGDMERKIYLQMLAASDVLPHN